jgi:hypothetical protein
MGAETKSPHGNNPDYFGIGGKIYHLVSPLRPGEAHKSGWRQIYFSIVLKKQQKSLKTNATKNI